MASHEILGGKVNVYRRGGLMWHCSATVKGRQFRTSTKETGLEQAKAFAEDWYLGLRGKAAAGILKTETTLAEAAKKFEEEYSVITEGERSPKWVEGHSIRLRLHLIPFFGKMGLSTINAGTVQDYRVHRINTSTTGKPPARSTLHDEVGTLRQVLKTAIRHKWLNHLPDLSPPYKTQGKIMHRPWFSPAEYKQLYEATRQNAKEPKNPHFRWEAEQLHDFILFMGNTGLRPDEAKQLQHRDVTIIEDADSRERILEIEVRGKRGIGWCKSMPGAVKPYERLRDRLKPVRGKEKEGSEIVVKAPQPTDLLFPGNYLKMFNNLLEAQNLKLDRDGKPRTAYSLRHTYICLRLMEGADVYAIAKNCRTSVEMIEKFYAAHIKTTLDASIINARKPKRVNRARKANRAAAPPPYRERRGSTAR
ncbi:site-specific integrase [Rhizobium sp. CB3171]|uniref:tyrosine-type recombinase/integrase n=1 Tax=Rhizobium sp. CB3171 TaxID=3039157 RepID=UPI0024B151DA|nr:site-specific integrase [Rhizobium sp. CB3171]WFU01925.1 site-specific integrase [Rhizobium sp. CB3171]